ncbi:MAG: acyl-CoA/acyl-ACP dehydrogenase [SAR86 cluster bacterium]|jgi:alkylation response protein AidB-like acyl-CoA dehydrogenase|uniref:Acyl-CoA/acyl-ACP dehydrogenase n=1 Tax=SAR86 cluster bacterium TaxID=2030880 RepID=A0A972VXR2_9GAMM|nr:acyl-CoA/acyl-ACP dehydrogenase [SAR86 cluster bacterium]
MNFGFTEEQDLLRDQVRKFLDAQSPVSRVREIMHTDEGFDRQIWQQIADLGWLGLVVDPEHDGVGLGFVDLIVILEEMGKSLFPSPFIAHSLAASTLDELASDDQKKRYLNDLACGRKIGTIALLDIHDLPNADSISLSGVVHQDGVILSGKKTFVMDADSADLFVVAFKDQHAIYLALISRDQTGVSTQGSATMDLTKRTGSLELDHVKVAPQDLILATAENISRLLDKAAVAVTAEVIGAAEAVIYMTSSYAKDRIQFDNPIGKYQGVKHRLAEMYVDVESFKSLLYYAAWCVKESPAELARSASLAKAYASDAFSQIGTDGVQLHGAIGFTQEYDMQLYLKRSKWARPIFGDADYHYERIHQLSVTD